MPLKRRYGFIFLDNNNSIEQQVHTIAHELGHGAFRLKHTFSEHPTLTKGTTNNLMDYSDSTHLFKYQWDYIHDPEAMMALWQDEEEGELISKYGMELDDDMDIGGLPQIIEYIITEKYDKFINVFNKHYEMDGEDLNQMSHEFVLKELFDNNIEIDIPEEARIINTIAYQYIVKKEIIKNQDKIIESIENNNDWDKQSIVEILSETLFKLATNEYVTGEIEIFLQAYFDTKTNVFVSKDLSAQKSFVYGIESNKRFERILRNVLKINDDERILKIMNLRRNGENIPEIEDFFKKSNSQHKMKSEISDNIKLSKLVKNNLNKQKTFIKESLISKKFFRVAKGSFVLMDFAFNIVDASNEEISPLTILSFHPAFGLLSIVFELEINRLSDMVDITTIEALTKWDDIVDWKYSWRWEQFNYSGLLLQYTAEREKFNFTTPTSIRILDRELAKKIFGFYPKYVNYDLPSSNNYESFIPKYYVPYIKTN
jgi:hypothetical protein